MITKRLFLRVGAIVLAVLLLSGYVYDRAGGHLLEKVGLRQPAPPTDEQLEMLSGSKSAMVVAPSDETLMYGSKSGVLVTPTPPQLPSEETQDPVQAARSSMKLLPGSKSLIIAEPQTGAAPQNNPPPAPPQREQLKVPPRLLPGSKSDVLFDPPANNVQRPLEQSRNAP